jgi:hypothetical protein
LTEGRGISEKLKELDLQIQDKCLKLEDREMLPLSPHHHRRGGAVRRTVVTVDHLLQPWAEPAGSKHSHADILKCVDDPKDRV